MDLVVAGYPCQPFSLAGKRAGEDDERHLWPAIRDIIDDLRPWLCVFENVPGHVSLGLDTVLRDLENLGYRSAGVLLRASDVGAPHRRERLFIMAALVADGLRSRLEVFCQELDHDGELEAGHDAHRCGEAVVELRGGREALPDADRSGVRLESERDQRDRWGVREAFGEYAEPRAHGFPGFPPLPDDELGWTRYLERWPDLEPSIRRGAHGLCAGVDRDHVDRLRALGNSVVQQQAEAAVRLLARGLYDNLFGGTDAGE